MDFDYTNFPGKFLDISKITRQNIIPLVTIITPFFNSGKYFEYTFNCVINQSFPWFEWIIVDDGSTNQKDINLLNQYQLKDSRIKIYKKANGGIASARNYAISKSSTDFIVPLDADDLISPVYLEINYWALNFNPSASWSYTDSVGFGDQQYLWKKNFNLEKLKVNNFLTCTAMIRKKSFYNVGYYSEVDKHFNEDWYAWLKLIRDGNFPVHISGYHFWYRRTNTGVLSQIRENKKLQKKSLNAIKNISKEITNSVSPLEYPLLEKTNVFTPPKKSTWKLSLEKSTRNQVLMLFPWLEMGGADAFNLSLIKYAKNSNWDIGIITTIFSNNTWKQRFEKYVDEIFELPNFLEVKNYAEFISYYIISRNIKTIFISNSYYGYYLIPWLRKEFHFINIIDYVHMEEWYWRHGGYARTSGVMGAFIDKTLVCNKNTQDVLVNYFNRNPKRVDVAYIGVDSDYYNRITTPFGQIREKLNLGNRKIILYPCRLDPQKRPHLMLEIVHELKTHIPDIALLVIGDGPLENEIKQLIKKYNLQNNVYMLGRQNDLRPYYRDSDLTLICSLKEGLSLTAYESCSMGVPVISSDVGGQKELVDETVGAIIPLYQEETDYDKNKFNQTEILEYVNNILPILSNKDYWELLSINCRKRICENFEQSKRMKFILQEIDMISKAEKIDIAITDYENLMDDYLTIYNEIENYTNSYNYSLERSSKRELMRIVQSRNGQRLLALAFKLHLNKLFK